MSYLTRPFGLGFLAVMIIMAFQITTKKTLCMDSSIVYKIDNTIAGKTESIYACRLHRSVPFSNFYNERRDEIGARLARLEILLYRIGAASPLRIEITPELLESEQFEKSVMQVALAKHLPAADYAFVNLLSDFLILSPSQGVDLISSAWWSSYRQLSLVERKRFFDFVLRQLRDTGATPASVAAYPEFSKLFSNKMKTLENESTAFDYVFETDDQNFLLSELTQLARNNTSVKVAFKNRSGIFSLPFMTKVPTVKETAVKAQYRFFSSNLKFKISNFAKNTEHLIVLKSMSQIKLMPLFTEDGLQGFLAANRQLDFIQFHMPSYALKAKELRKITDYFSFVETKKAIEPERKALGWLVSEWVQERKAFKAVAIFDVIQYYRINPVARH